MNETNLAENRQIRIFISSTFRDMQAERDYLVRNIFPSLRRYCAERDVTLYELDLRWGITEEESKQGKVVDICLTEIQKTRPFFIGLLGNRYGWIPNDEERRAISVSSPIFDTYPWLESTLKDGTSITEIEIHEGVLRSKEKVNAYFYLRGPQIEVPASFKEEPGSFAEKKLNALKERIFSQKEYPVKHYSSIEELGIMVENDFRDLVDSIYPQGALSPLEKERFEQRAFLRRLCENYVPVPDYMERLDAFASGSEKGFAVIGESGMGKSALLANWINSKQDGEKIVYHFIGETGAEGNYHKITAHLINEIRDLFGLKKENTESEEENDYAGQKEELQNLVMNIPSDEKLIIVLDGINKLDLSISRLAWRLNWLPVFPDNVKVIYAKDEEIGLENKFTNFIRLDALPLETRKQIIYNYYEKTGKKLSASQVDRIASDKKSENALALITMLNQIRIFGVYEKLDEHIAALLASPSIDALFTLFLERLEGTFNFNESNFVADVFTFIEITRYYGLTESEIIALTGAAPLYWAQLFSAIDSFTTVKSGLVAFSTRLIWEPVKKRYLSVPVPVDRYRKRFIDYLKSGTADTNRVYAELPFQLYMLKDWEGLYQFLLDFKVFEYLYKNDKLWIGRYWACIAPDDFTSGYYKQPNHGCADSGKYSIAAFLTLEKGNLDNEAYITALWHIAQFVAANYPLMLRFAEKCFGLCSALLGNDNQLDIKIYKSLSNDLLRTLSRYQSDGKKSQDEVDKLQSALASLSEIAVRQNAAILEFVPDSVKTDEFLKTIAG